MNILQVSEDAWGRVKAIEEDLEKYDILFESLTEKIASDVDEWEEWFNNPEPEKIDLPGEYKVLVGMPKLLLLRVFRPDRLPMAMKQFIREKMGPNFMSETPPTTDSIFDHASCHTPLLFALCPQFDPSTIINDLAEKRHLGHEKRAVISLGQGQEKAADALIQKMSKMGGWLQLLNVQITPLWLESLESKIDELSPHEDFRLFITAEAPTNASQRSIVPERLIQICHCVVHEPMQDMRSNMIRAWHCFSQDRIDKSRTPALFKACLFGLSFFHASAVGREYFGTIGWSQPYKFSIHDLQICADITEKYINNDPLSLPWRELRYM